MNTKNCTLSTIVLVAVIFLGASGCTPSQVTELPSTLTPTRVPTETIIPTATPLPLAPLTLRPGDFYFSVDGKPSFIFSRNPAGYYMGDFDTLMPMLKDGGSTIARIQVSTIVAGGMGYTNTGMVDEAWANKWKHVFDTAQANGIYVIVVFTGWYDWNTTGFNNWAANPFNAANGGPAQTPHELFQKDSTTQKSWLAWLKNIVTRWQSQKNILAWEIYSEANLTQGVTEPEGTDLVTQASAVIRSADAAHRLITASLAEVGDWPNFYRSGAIDFINAHPYPPSAQLDREIISEVRQKLTTYNRPVLIGESGLNADSPENYPPNAKVGVSHAIWAGIVSGAMNGRALYWEDGYGLYFQSLGWPWVWKYGSAELPAANFVRGMDLSGFKPLTVYFPAGTKVWGAAVGNEKTVIGWFRDANSEPPDWKLEPVISKQTVTISVPGSSSRWKVDFYNTKTGTDVITSAFLTPQGNNVTLALPDFNDDIAFKMISQSSSISTAAPVTGTPMLTSTDLIAEKWTGTIVGENSNFSERIDLSILPACQIGSVCGTVSATPCTGTLALQEIDGDTFVFIEQNMTGAVTCLSGGKEYLQLQADGTLLFRFKLTTAQGTAISSNGILKRQ